MKNSIKSKLLTTGMALFALCAFADPETGWKQTAAGTYDYNDTANWVGGNINGVFDASLAIEGEQTITFSSDTTLGDGLTINQTGAYAIKFNSSGGTVALTLGGNVVNASAGSVTFESGLSLNLGGAVRTISSENAMTIKSAMSNGGVVYHNVGQVTVSGNNTYGLGTWLKGTGFVVMGSDYAFGGSESDLHLCEGARIYSNQKNGGKTLQNGNKLIIEGDCTFGTASKDSGGIDFSSSAISIIKPVTVTFARYRFAFGSLSADSPCGWSDIETACGYASTLATVSFANLSLKEGETFRMDQADVVVTGGEMKGTLELWGGSIVLDDSLHLPYATVALRNNATLSLKSTTGGTVSPLKKIVCGGGTISYYGVANIDTVYEVEIELDNVHGTPNLDPHAVSGATTTLRAKPFVKGPGAMLNVGTFDYGSSVRFEIDGQDAAEILPWARATDGAFVGYDATTGLVAFDASGEDCVTYAAGMTSSDLANKHVVIPDGVTFTPDADVAVKSLGIAIAGGTPIGESGFAITVSSGAVNFWSTNTSEIKSALDFGVNHGYISFRNGGIAKLGADIKGSNGITVSDLSPAFNTGKDYKGLNFNSATTYTGDTYINGVVFPGNSTCFPNGTTRSGNVYNEGYFNIWKGNYGTLYMNGYNGTGSVMKDSGVVVVKVGCDGSDGVFDGEILDNKAVGLEKVGSGTQVVNGNVNCQKSVVAGEGCLELNGVVSVSGQAIVVCKSDGAESGGTLTGVASIHAPHSVVVREHGTLFPGSSRHPAKAMALDASTSLVFEEGAKLQFHVGPDYASQLLCEAAISGSGVNVPVTITGEGGGRWKLIEALSIEPTFSKAAGSTGRLVRVAAAESESGKEELWLERTAGFTIIIR